MTSFPYYVATKKTPTYNFFLEHLRLFCSYSVLPTKPTYEKLFIFYFLSPIEVGLTMVVYSIFNAAYWILTKEPIVFNLKYILYIYFRE